MMACRTPGARRTPEGARPPTTPNFIDACAGAPWVVPAGDPSPSDVDDNDDVTDVITITTMAIMMMMMMMMMMMTTTTTTRLEV